MIPACARVCVPYAVRGGLTARPPRSQTSPAIGSRTRRRARHCATPQRYHMAGRTPPGYRVPCPPEDGRKKRTRALRPSFIRAPAPTPNAKPEAIPDSSCAPATHDAARPTPVTRRQPPPRCVTQVLDTLDPPSHSIQATSKPHTTHNKCHRPLTRAPHARHAPRHTRPSHTPRHTRPATHAPPHAPPRTHLLMSSMYSSITSRGTGPTGSTA